MVEQHNGLYARKVQAARVARRLSHRQLRSGWVSVYHVPVLTGAAGGWEPGRRIMEQLRPEVTYFHGCPVKWVPSDSSSTGGKLVMADPTCPPQGGAPAKPRPWTAGLQQQIFPHKEPEPTADADTDAVSPPATQDIETNEHVFGFVIGAQDTQMQRLKRACITLGIPHENREDYESVIEQYGCGYPYTDENNTECTFATFIRRIEADAHRMRGRLQQDASGVPSPRYYAGAHPLGAPAAAAAAEEEEAAAAAAPEEEEAAAAPEEEEEAAAPEEETRISKFMDHSGNSQTEAHSVYTNDNTEYEVIESDPVEVREGNEEVPDSDDDEDAEELDAVSDQGVVAPHVTVEVSSTPSKTVPPPDDTRVAPLSFYMQA